MHIAKFNLHLFGPFQLYDAQKKEVILGRKAQALLAILAISGGKPRSRAVLQDLLWSDRGEQHGRDSLKKVLSSLRATLNSENFEVLRTRGGPVSLDMSAFNVDLNTTDAKSRFVTGEEFLEGCEVRDPQFETWLRQQRMSLQVTDAAISTQPSNRLIGGHLLMRPKLGVSSMTNSFNSAEAQLYADIVRTRSIVSLTQSELFEVVDLQTTSEAQSACEFVIDIRSIETRERTYLGLTLRNSSNASVLWGQTHTIESSPSLEHQFANIVSHSVDQVVQMTLRSDPNLADEQRTSAHLALRGIDAMFCLSPNALAESEDNLRAAIEIEPKGTYLAWSAYLTAFRLESRLGRDFKQLREEANATAMRALENDPTNPLVRALLAHVFGFVFHDADRASALLSPIGSINVDNPMVHHSCAMRHFYDGRFEDARKAALTSYRLGSYHAYAYGFRTSLCMIELLRGDLKSAIRFGEEARRLALPNAPIFGPLLRYLAAAYALNGDVVASENLWSCMDVNGRGRFVASLSESNVLVPSQEARSLLKKGFQQFVSSQDTLN